MAHHVLWMASLVSSDGFVAPYLSDLGGALCIWGSLVIHSRKELCFIYFSILSSWYVIFVYYMFIYRIINLGMNVYACNPGSQR